MLRGELVHDYPSRLLCKDGSIKDVIVLSNRHLDLKRFLYARCFVRDVTELVRLQTLLTSTIAKLAQKDRLRQRSMNRAYPPLTFGHQTILLEERSAEPK